MKYLLCYLFMLITLISGFAQTSSYKEKLKKEIHAFETAQTSADFDKAAKAFEVLASSQKNDWLPFYYSGICAAIVAFQKPKGEIDSWCDRAESYARRADSLSKNNSEVLVLHSMIAAARINVDRNKRGKKFGAIATKYALEAIRLNNENPRAHFVKAQAILNTPPAFGGGEKKAKPVFELSLEKHKSFKPESSLHPQWGKAEAEKELKKLNKS